MLTALLGVSSTAMASHGVDSIGVENVKGKKVILYKVEPKETYYSIAKKYNIPYKDLMDYNDAQLLQIGITLKVPTNLPFTATSTAPVKNQSGSYSEYTVKAKDNLNLIANKFGTTVDEIKRLNELSSINLQIGQLLKIPQGTESASAQGSSQVKTTTSEQPVQATTYKKPEKKVEVPVVNTPELSTPPANVTVISHTVAAKEYLNLIAEKYGTTADAIKKLNDLRSANLKIGQVLKIPATKNESAAEGQTAVNTNTEKSTTIPASNTTAVNNTSNKVEGGFEHVVVAGETIYSIAKKYNLTTYQLKTANNLTENELVVGQRLMIKNAVKPSNTTVANDDDEEGSTETLKNPKLKQPGKFGIVRFDEKGIAIWIADADLDPSKMLVLHRTAPVGTVIQITNPMTNRSTFAKVVGKFTENESTKDVIIVMTKAVADAVGALDKRFACTLNYGVVENEQ